MLFIRRHQNNPWFNIAAEEFVMKYLSDDVVMTWQSKPAVIVGKHQNIVSEVNLPYVYQQSIPIIRRISGGGTVFHGEGNLNYSLITTGKNSRRLIDFKTFTRPVVEFLLHYGVTADFAGKNNLRVNGKKFSGNSAHLLKNRIIHHGTLLFDTDLELLEKVIHPSVATVADKAISSVRATVGNLKPHLPSFFNFEEFQHAFDIFLSNYFPVVKKREFSHNEEQKIEHLAREKYHTIAWNFGYSPDYTFQKQVETIDGKMKVELYVSKGIISDIRLFYKGMELKKIERLLKGKWHEPETLQNELRGNRFAKTMMEVLF